MPRKATGGKPGRPFHPELLTPSEQRVLEGVREGLHNAEIGVRLGISPDGVKFHVSNMLAKLGLSSREELARWQPPREGMVRRMWTAVPVLAKWAVAGAAVVAAGGVVAFALFASSSSSADTGLLTDGLVSVSGKGEPGNGNSLAAAMSDDGRYVVFQSSATNLVSGDTNGVDDIFLRDRLKGTTVRVSRAKDGDNANGPSRDPVISRDGSHIAYVSVATNIVDVPPVTDDDALRVIAATGQAPPSDNLLNPIARANVYEYDLKSGKTSLVSVTLDGHTGNLGSGGPSLSRDGRYVAFDSIATNLVQGDTNLGKGGLEGDLLFGASGCDVFVRDMYEGKTTRVSLRSDGTEADGSSSAPALSGDGQVVAFLSDAENLDPAQMRPKDVFVHEMAGGRTYAALPPVSDAAGVSPGLVLDISNPAVSADGSVAGFVTLSLPTTSGQDIAARFWRVGIDPHQTTFTLAVSSVRGQETPIDGSGSTFSFLAKPSGGDTAQITLLDTRSGVATPVRLTVAPDPDNGTPGFNPLLSGDGRFIGYLVSVNGHTQVAVQRR